jgi:hypothetical protein
VLLANEAAPTVRFLEIMDDALIGSDPAGLPLSGRLGYRLLVRYPGLPACFSVPYLGLLIRRCVMKGSLLGRPPQ